jgi:hypothetical protein
VANRQSFGHTASNAHVGPFVSCRDFDPIAFGSRTTLS